MDRAAIYSFVAGEKYAVVSSVADDGTPQSALVGIAVTPELEVILDTLKSSRKYSNLKRRPACSLVIGLSGAAGESTVQMEGFAHEPTGDDLSRYLDIYFARWPECRCHLNWAGITHFVVRPKWLRYSDYAVAPPVIREFTF